MVVGVALFSKPNSKWNKCKPNNKPGYSGSRRPHCNNIWPGYPREQCNSWPGYPCEQCNNTWPGYPREQCNTWPGYPREHCNTWPGYPSEQCSNTWPGYPSEQCSNTWPGYPSEQCNNTWPGYISGCVPEHVWRSLVHLNEDHFTYDTTGVNGSAMPAL